MYAIVWSDPDNGIASVPRNSDGTPMPILELEQSLRHGEVIASVKPGMIVMLVSEEDLQ